MRAVHGVLLGVLVLGVQLLALPACATAPAKPGLRTLYLVRHGLYDETDRRDPEVGRGLTAEGREQARLTGERLAATPVRFTAIHASTMTRARETAEIIARALPGLEPQLARDLRECLPPSESRDVMSRAAPGEPQACRERLDRAFRRYFRPSLQGDSSEIVVGHGNAIRYFCCRALGLDPENWLRLDLMNCGVTVIEIRPDGTMRMVSFDDVGHLPARLRTFGLGAPFYPGAH